MHTAFLLMGGNLGDRLANLHAANERLARHCGTIVKTSAIYQTAAWGLEEQPPFLNQAIELQTFSNAHVLLQCLLEVEHSLGRVRDKRYGPRLIDVDILLFDDAIIASETLKIPHPELHNRRFALTCLADIAPEKVHPLFQKSIAQLLQECPDNLAVHKFSGGIASR